MKPSLEPLLVLAGAAASSQAQSHPRRQSRAPATSCATLKAPTVPNATVVSMQAAERRNFTLPSGLGGPGGPGAGAGASAPPPRLDFCDVNVTLTHGTANDSVRVEVWMPLEGWNGRFQGTGGGGFIAGTFGAAMAPQVAAGFAAASTDAGLRPASFDGSGIRFDDQLMANFAFLSVHEMAVVGKAVTQQFYGTADFFSYWNGCSTGGRQGYMEAQRFPGDFDGILAAAPAIHWDRFCPAEFWPFQVQSEAGAFVPACVAAALTQATVEACDGLDGGMDGLISDPGACRFDAGSAVGRTVPCGGGAGNATTITAAHASLFNRMVGGPVAPNGTRLWFGVEPGTSLAFLAGTTPFSLGATWLDTFVAGDGAAPPGRLGANRTLSAQAYATLFQQSVAGRFGALLATDDADLSGLRAAGGRLLSWHGLADPIIPPQGTLDYRRRVEAAMGGDGGAVDEFYRLFTAPGVGHCGGGAAGAPAPGTAAALDVLVAWVERGVAPDTLPASAPAAATAGRSATVTRNLCRFPLAARFGGSGSVDDAAGWSCVPSQGVEATLPGVGTAAASGRLGLRQCWVILVVLEWAWLLL